MSDFSELPAQAFAKRDPSPDGLFYAEPRFVTHIDDRAVAAVTNLYRATFRPGDRLLDLMSSWVSHLPDDVAYAEVVGLGMNAAELAANPRLARRTVQDLNETPALPFETESFDGAACCVSIQYLQRPVSVQDLNEAPALPFEAEGFDGAACCVSVQYLQRPVSVLREVLRCLKPGAPVAITFSDRCFPTKAVAIWQADGIDNADLVTVYLSRAGFDRVEARQILSRDRFGDPLWAVVGRRPG